MADFQIFKWELEPTPTHTHCFSKYSSHWDWRDWDKRRECNSKQALAAISRVDRSCFSYTPIRGIRDSQKEYNNSKYSRNHDSHARIRLGIEFCKFQKRMPVLRNNNWEKFKDIYQNLTKKSFKLVKKAKQSRFGGFFSPLKLKNKISNEKFIKIVPSSHYLNRKRAMSPWNIIRCSEESSNSIFKIENSNKINKTSKITANNNEFILNRVGRESKLEKLKELFQKIKSEEINLVI